MGIASILPVRNILNLVLAAIVLLTLLTLTLIFATYKFLIYIIIRWKHGDEFHAMMDGPESLFSIKDQSRSISNSLFFIKHNDDEGDVVDYVLKRCKQAHTVVPKCTLRTSYFMGYYYFLKGEFSKDVVKFMKPYKTMDDLKMHISEVANGPIGPEDERIYELYLGVQPIQIDGEECYPILIRAYHCMGDAFALFNAKITAFNENPKEDIIRSYEELNAKTEKAQNKSELANSTLWSRLWNMRIHTTPLFRRKEKSMLHGKELSGHKYCIWLDGNVEQTKKVKSIKARFKGVSFNTVVFSALAASFHEYFKKHDPENIPDYVMPATVVLPEFPKLSNMVVFEGNNVKRLNMFNSFSVCLMRLPLIKQTNSRFPLVKQLFEVRSEIKKATAAIDVYTNTLIMNFIMRYWPVPIVNINLHNLETTMILSSFPSTSRCKHYTFIQNYKKTGMGLGISVVDDRIRLGLTVDRALISDVKNAEEFLSNILKNIDILDEQIKLMDGSVAELE